MNKKKKIIKEIRSWVFCLSAAVLMSVMVNSEVFAKVKVEQSSMENTLYNNQQLIIDKVSYNFVEPKRGDIIVFLENQEKGTIVDKTIRFVDNFKKFFTDDKGSNNLIKRVIGIPGDEVNIKDGYVYVNGEKLDESYIKGETFGNELMFPIKVTDNQVFVLGDNRPVSRDSREFGLINYNQIEGKAILRVFPFDNIGIVK
ncbi:MAG: signal peptidase I [Clostridiaceae bacterium]